MAFIVKHYVVKTLTSVCGEYVEGITSDKLDLSLVSGEVRLRDLSVKPAVRPRSPSRQRKSQPEQTAAC